MVSIIIVNYNSPHLIQKCIETIFEFIKSIDFEVIIVDNLSSNENLDEIKKRYKNITVVRLAQNLGFGWANNIGISFCKYENIFFLNSDTELINHTIDDMFRYFFNMDGHNIISPSLKWPDQRFQNSYCRSITTLNFWMYTSLASIAKHLSSFNSKLKYHKYDFKPFKEITRVDIVYATAIMVKKADFLTIGGFDTSYFMYFEDIDFVQKFSKLLKGKIYIYPNATLIHHGQGSSNGSKLLKVNGPFFKSLYKFGYKHFQFIPITLFLFTDIIFSTVSYPIRLIVKYLIYIKKWK